VDEEGGSSTVLVGKSEPFLKLPRT
jgi:hypothetical protein